MNDLDVQGIRDALNDSGVRTIWMNTCLDELMRINREVDRRLLSGEAYGLVDLCARRKAYQDILENVLSARRAVTQGVAHNPLIKSAVDLDRVTG